MLQARERALRNDKATCVVSEGDDAEEADDDRERRQAHRYCSAPDGSHGNNGREKKSAGTPKGTELWRESETSLGMSHAYAGEERQPDAKVVAMRHDFVAEPIELTVQFDQGWIETFHSRNLAGMRCNAVVTSES